MAARGLAALTALLLAMFSSGADAYPGGTPDFQTDVAPFCAACHSSVDARRRAACREGVGGQQAPRADPPGATPLRQARSRGSHGPGRGDPGHRRELQDRDRRLPAPGEGGRELQRHRAGDRGRRPRGRRRPGGPGAPQVRTPGHVCRSRLPDLPGARGPFSRGRHAADGCAPAALQRSPSHLPFRPLPFVLLPAEAPGIHRRVLETLDLLLDLAHLPLLLGQVYALSLSLSLVCGAPSGVWLSRTSALSRVRG